MLYKLLDLQLSRKTRYQAEANNDSAGKKRYQAEESVAGTAKPKYLSEAKPNEAFAVIRESFLLYRNNAYCRRG